MNKAIAVIWMLLVNSEHFIRNWTRIKQKLDRFIGSEGGNTVFFAYIDLPKGCLPEGFLKKKKNQVM